MFAARLRAAQSVSGSRASAALSQVARSVVTLVPMETSTSSSVPPFLTERLDSVSGIHELFAASKKGARKIHQLFATSQASGISTLYPIQSRKTHKSVVIAMIFALSGRVENSCFLELSEKILAVDDHTFHSEASPFVAMTVWNGMPGSWRASHSSFSDAFSDPQAGIYAFLFDYSVMYDDVPFIAWAIDVLGILRVGVITQSRIEHMYPCTCPD